MNSNNKYVLCEGGNAIRYAQACDIKIAFEILKQLEQLLKPENFQHISIVEQEKEDIQKIVSLPQCWAVVGSLAAYWNKKQQENVDRVFRDIDIVVLLSCLGLSRREQFEEFLEKLPQVTEIKWNPGLKILSVGWQIASRIYQVDFFFARNVEHFNYLTKFSMTFVDETPQGEVEIRKRDQHAQKLLSNLIRIAFPSKITILDKHNQLAEETRLFYLPQEGVGLGRRRGKLVWSEKEKQNIFRPKEAYRLIYPQFLRDTETISLILFGRIYLPSQWICLDQVLKILQTSTTKHATLSWLLRFWQSLVQKKAIPTQWEAYTFKQIERLKNELQANLSLREYKTKVRTLNFESFVEQKQASQQYQRQSIPHLFSFRNPQKESFSFEQFKKFIAVLQREGGVLTQQNIDVLEKIDGVSIRFGWDPEHKQFVLASSYSGLVSSPEQFEELKPNTNNPRIKHEPTRRIFQLLFSDLQKLMIQWNEQAFSTFPFLQQYGYLFQAELLHRPETAQQSNDIVQINNIAYYSKIFENAQNVICLLKFWPFVDYHALSSSKKQLYVKYEDSIFKDLSRFASKATQAVRILHIRELQKQKLSQQNWKIDLNKELKEAQQMLIEQTSSANSTYLYLFILRQIAQKIWNSLKNYKLLGPETEGYVLQFKKYPDIVFKLINPLYWQRRKMQTLSTASKSNKQIVDYAFLPGSFRPPHAGHFALIQQFAEKSQRVIVVVSSPQQQVRKIGEVASISAEIASKILRIFADVIQTYTSTPIDVIVSPTPSPLQYIVDQIDQNSYFNNCSIVIGSSKKNKNDQRWPHLQQRWQTRNIRVLDTQQMSITPLKINGKEISASNIRQQLEQVHNHKELEKVYRAWLPSHLSQAQIKQIVNLLAFDLKLK